MWRRGANLDGDVANFIETEQLVEMEGFQSSLLQSVLLVGIGNNVRNEILFSSYCLCFCSRYVSFDFHHVCGNSNFENLKVLYEQISEQFEKQGYFLVGAKGNILEEQKGIVRSNCIDCLDRTNVTQSYLAQKCLDAQLQRTGVLDSSERISMFAEDYQTFRALWVEQGDEISLEYAGTYALKGDLVRYGKQTFGGIIKDVSALSRNFLNNFQDGIRQDAMDLISCRYTVRRDISPSRPEYFSHSHTIRNLVLLKFLHGFFLLVLCMMSTSPESAAFPGPTLLGNESDRLALLDFKKRITEDPLSVMSSWNHSIHFCSWRGITCHRATQRVLILDLEDKQLVGSIPPSIGNLTRLIEISLGINKFHGEIPQELGRLRALESLNLSSNSLGGKIPTNMSHCTQLREFDLDSNKIIGSIPHQLGSWLSLTGIHLTYNNLSGSIPGWIGNFSSLSRLRLGGNNFQGNIPNELGHITTLKIFVVEGNNLSGMLPSSIYNISSISIFSVVGNQLHGELPPNLGILLPNLVLLFCGGNNFTGNIPHVGYGCDR
ncbi:hypothetical protein DVH24_036160 [Malus domestica]|uniref:SAC domain-containing protein n=1 Tax=Malus domestica TaxID=3750 RepID=A0A498IFK9_MALDO|nr:hypothetical protein DVH24_036160 [Malus domestica]